MNWSSNEISQESEVSYDSSKIFRESLYLQSVRSMSRGTFNRDYRLESTVPQAGGESQREYQTYSSSADKIQINLRSSRTVQTVYKSQMHFLELLAIIGGVLCLLLTIG